MAIRGSTLGAIIPVSGPAGTSGQSTYSAWLALGNTGSLADFIAAQKGEPGGVATLAGKIGDLSLDDIGARAIAESARTFAAPLAAAVHDLSGEGSVILTRFSITSRVRPVVYRNVGKTRPLHNACFQDLKGYWFENAEPVIRVYDTGALGGFSADDLPAFQIAVGLAMARGGGIIDAGGDNFIVSDVIKVFGDKIHLFLYGTEIASTSLTADIIRFGFANPGPTDLRSNVGVHGGSFVYTDPNVTAGAAINFDRCQYSEIENVKTYGAFVGVRLAACVGISVRSLKTDNGTGWTTVKPGSAGLLLTGSAGSLWHNNAITVTDSNISGNNINRCIESAVRLEEVDGVKFAGTYMSFADKIVSLKPYSSTSPLSLIEFFGCGFDTPTSYHFYAPAMPGYAGNYVFNKCLGAYIYNAGTAFGLFALKSSNAQKAWRFEHNECRTSGGDGFILTGVSRHSFAYNIFGDMARGGSNSATCFRVQGCTKIRLRATDYEHEDSDINFAHSIVSLEAGSDDILVESWAFDIPDNNLHAVLRDATCGPNMSIRGGHSPETTIYAATSPALTIPASVEFVQVYAQGLTTGIDAASTWRGRIVKIVFLNGTNLQSSSTFILKGGSRTVAANDTMQAVNTDGTTWREI